MINQGAAQTDGGHTGLPVSPRELAGQTTPRSIRRRLPQRHVLRKPPPDSAPGRDTALVTSAAPGPDAGLDVGSCLNEGLLDGGSTVRDSDMA